MIARRRLRSMFIVLARIVRDARGGLVREASLAIRKLGLPLADGLGFDQAWPCARWFCS